MRVLELFCGIGGVSALLSACGTSVEVVEATDLDRVALRVYSHNFAHPVAVRNLAGVTAVKLPDADLWTLAPPCQPHTRRGKGRDLEDPRSAPLIRLMGVIPQARPRFVFLENVPGFRGSQAHAALREALDGYLVDEIVICPSELGWPNRRRRFYLVASRDEPLLPFPKTPDSRTADSLKAMSGEREPVPRRRLADLGDPAQDANPELAVEPDLSERYAGALSIVDRHDPAAVTACFTSAYGRSPVRSGSYLRMGDGALRRFHPREILSLLGFPPAYNLPPELPLPNAWRLAGNTLSLPAVRHALSALPLDFQNAVALEPPPTPTASPNQKIG